MSAELETGAHYNLGNTFTLASRGVSALLQRTQLSFGDVYHNWASRFLLTDFIETGKNELVLFLPERWTADEFII